MEGMSVVAFKLCSVGTILVISLVGSFLPLKLRTISAEKRVSLAAPTGWLPLLKVWREGDSSNHVAEIFPMFKPAVVFAC